jgi:uncharacterized protein DUF4242
MAKTASRHLNSYLVESYWPGVSASQVAAMAGRATDAATKLTSRGVEIRYRSALLVSQDEVTFCLFEATSQASVSEACRAASLPFDRILHVVEIKSGTMPPSPDTEPLSGRP